MAIDPVEGLVQFGQRLAIGVFAGVLVCEAPNAPCGVGERTLRAQAKRRPSAAISKRQI